MKQSTPMYKDSKGAVGRVAIKKHMYGRHELVTLILVQTHTKHTSREA